MNIEFSQIPEILPYPRKVKGVLSTLHADVITYVTTIYDGSHNLRRNTIKLLNTITKYVVNGDAFPEDWSSKNNPFNSLIIEDEFMLKDILGELYINPKNINWDIPIVNAVQVSSPVDSKIKTAPQVIKENRHKESKIKLVEKTNKSDLYIQSPVVPQFDVNRPWVSKLIDGTIYCIYTSIPEIPTKQNEISITTNVSNMSERDLLKLFPNTFIQTRSHVMYEYVSNLNYHPQLGVILPVEGFSESDMIDNLIQYPHLFKLLKYRDKDLISFYNTIEINGELYKVSDVWNTLPDTSRIPYTADFVKEYVVRRYLLERDLKGIQHKYPMYGKLDPFLTLFTTVDDYVKFGYTDVVDIARRCVSSRIEYKKSRNPVLRRIQDA